MGTVSQISYWEKIMFEPSPIPITPIPITPIPINIDLREIPTFWINLNKDIGRRTRMESMFVQLEMENNKRVSGYLADTVLEGCGKAQEKTLKKIRKYPTLVLEDDCMPTEHFLKPR